MKTLFLKTTLLCTFVFLAKPILCAKPLNDYSGHTRSPSGAAVDLRDTEGNLLRLRAYGDSMIRVQMTPAGKTTFPDDHYLMIERHDFGGTLQVAEQTPDQLTITSPRLRVIAHKRPLRLEFFDQSTGRSLLKEDTGANIGAKALEYRFQVDPSEHFIGYGQKRLSLQDTFVLNGRSERRNYSEDGYPGRGSQGVLIVPFYISSKGYGLFANSTFQNEAHFNHPTHGYCLRLETAGEPTQGDYVFIFGPQPAAILDQYTSLTGRPRLPAKSIFGIHLSDNDPRLPDDKPIDQNWWKTMVANHRAAGFPLDHIVFDNDWRAASPLRGGEMGLWGGSQFAWEPTRYPDPKEFRTWCDKEGLTLTLDLNLNNCNDSAGWQPSFNLKPTDKNDDVKSPSEPDFSNPVVRRWIWDLFWSKAFDPALKYPGDAIWLDEPDGIWAEPKHRLANGRTWHEMQNYYFFLYASAVAGEGWDNAEKGATPGIGEAKRPHIWIRGGTAGMQRYASHWTGDIDFTQPFYRGHIIGMQASGLAGFPFFNHDAGGFGRNQKDPTGAGDVEGPDDNYYIQWGMALGSFTPLWRPHGYGHPRWPLNRSKESQRYFRQYATLRYEMMPYIYSMAHEANARGMPLARPLAVMYPERPEAWDPAHQYQYFWGDALMIVPAKEISSNPLETSAWFPPAARWYDFWTNEQVNVAPEGAVKTITTTFGRLPVFVRAGAIIPRQKFALSTAWLSDAALHLDVFAGADGRYELQEDDGVSERFRTRGELRRTTIVYRESPTRSLTIQAAVGSYAGASAQREYRVRIHGLERSPAHVSMNSEALPLSPSQPTVATMGGARWDDAGKFLEVTLPATSVAETVTLTWSEPQ